MFPVPFVAPDSVAWAPGRSRGNLPHLEKPGCSYFVTFCVREARLPRGKNDLSTFDEVAVAGEPLGGGGAAIMAKPGVSTLVEDAMLHFQGDRYLLSAWCVMPDHVHAVVTPLGGRTLASVLHSWKSFSAHGINRLLARTGPVWQEETFDHLIRTPEGFRRFCGYVEDNPVAAELCERREEWPFSSARFSGTTG